MSARARKCLSISHGDLLFRKCVGVSTTHLEVPTCLHGFSGYSSLLPPSVAMHVGFISELKLSVGVNVWLFVSIWPATCLGCTPPLAQWHRGPELTQPLTQTQGQAVRNVDGHNNSIWVRCVKYFTTKVNRISAVELGTENRVDWRLTWLIVGTPEQSRYV